MASPGEPTQLFRIFGSYHSQVKPPTDRSYGERTGKRPLATRLAFDETFEETSSLADHKIPRLNRDPFDSALGRKRFASENVGSNQREKLELQERIRCLEAEVAGCKGREASAENRLKQVELTLSTERLENDRKLEKITRMHREEKERNGELVFSVKKAREGATSRLDQEIATRRKSIDRTAELEAKIRLLRQGEVRRDDEIQSLQNKLAARADIDRKTYLSQVMDFKSQISDVKFQLGEKEAEVRSLSARLDSDAKSRPELEIVKEELKRSNFKVERLKAELEANREAVIQRKAMKERLEMFGELQQENSQLKRMTSLLQEGQGNVALLNEKIQNLTADKERAERRARDRDTLRAELECSRRELREWTDMMVGFSTADQRKRLVEVGVSTAREIIASFQSRELQLSESLALQQGEVTRLKRNLDQQAGQIREMETELTRIKSEQTEQTKLVKKLQRKLLLVTKERDSYKGILDSYEKEITMSGAQLDKERVEALEKTLEEYKAMVEFLEKEKGISVSHPGLEFSSGGGEWKEKHDALLAKVENLQLQLDQRAIKGDYNPGDTKVLHFKNNPFQLAVEEKARDTDTLVRENEALKARIQLLEEGQTKDLTILVGHKMDEGASSQEVIQLRENLKSAEVKNQRIMEVFKKTSHDFREVVLQITGYRIDVKGENCYKIVPIYADSHNDFLLFQKTETGVSMLESEFSLELSDLMELHLEKQNSFPMLMAGLTMKLFKKSQGCDDEDDNDGGGDDGNDDDDDDDHNEDDEEEVEEVEEENDDDEDGDGDGESSEEGEDGQSSGGEIVCIDDD